MNKEPTSEVLMMHKIAFTGNVIPHSWYQKLKYPSGVTNLPAIVILSEICYWYRPVEIRDEDDPTVLKLEKKFQSDKLQRSYESFSNLGLTKRQAFDACHFLKELGLIQLEKRTITTKTGMKIPNVLFIGINPREISKLNQPMKEVVDEPTVLPTGNEVSKNEETALPVGNGSLPTSNGSLPTGNSTESTTENSTKIYKEAADDAALVVVEKSITLEMEVPQRIMYLEELSRSDLEYIPHTYKLDCGVNNGKKIRRIPNSFQQRMLLLSSYLSNMPIAESKAGAEVKAAKELENLTLIGTYTEDRIYSSTIWGWINDEFESGKYKHGKNLRGILKLLPKVPKDIKNNLYKSSWKNIEQNKEEMINDAARASKEFAARHGITARPKL